MTKEEIKFIEQMFYAKRNGTHVSEGDIYELEQDGKTARPQIMDAQALFTSHLTK